MTMYPKLPDGPSSLGTAQVREQRVAGGDYQFSQRDSITQARVSGEFSRVNVQQIGYLTYGYPKTTTKQAGYSVQRIKQTALPWLAPLYEVTDFALAPISTFVKSVRASYAESYDITYTYTFDVPLPGGGTSSLSRSEEFSVRRRRFEVNRYNKWGGKKFLAALYPATTLPTYPFASEDRPGYPIFEPSIAFAGKVPNEDEGRSVDTLFSAYPIFSETLDMAGRPRNKLNISVIPMVGNKLIAYNLEIHPAAFTDPDAEFAQRMPCVATEHHLGVILRERFYWTEYVTSLDSPDYARKLWLIKATGKDFNALTAYDMTSLFADQLSTEAFWAGPGFRTPSEASTSYDELAAFHMRTVVLPNDVFLLSYFVARIGMFEGYYRVYFDTRIARISLETGSATITYSESREDVGNLFNAGSLIDFLNWPGLVVTDMVHLGEGHVIAKLADGVRPLYFDGADDVGGFRTEPGTEALTFIRSIDGGLNWFEFTPSGFDADLELGKFGDLTVIEPRLSGEHGVITVNSWRPDTNSYHVYISKNGGNSWERGAKITSTTEFKRMDGLWKDTTGLSNDSNREANTFRHLIGLQDIVQDLALPERYTDKSND